jgi:hypothetical protein
MVRQVITLEPLDTDVLFYLYPLQWLRLSAGYLPFPGGVGENLYARRSHNAYLRYTAVSRIVPEGRSPLEKGAVAAKLDPRVRDAYLQLPESLSPRIGELARTITSRAKAESDLAKAMALKAYLENPANFLYTLDVSHTPGAEPVEDFLFTQRAGHCEYFAAAMAVMLRTLGVPARLVNGFRLGEWNDLGGFYTVRQTDAHSWVEAYLEGQGWTTFDPSPHAAEEITAGWLGSFFWKVIELAESQWVNHVIGYDQNEQKEFLARLRAMCSLSEGEGAPRLLRPFQWLAAVLARKIQKNPASPNAPESVEQGPSLAPWVILSTLVLIFCAVFLTLLRRAFRRASGPTTNGLTVEYQRFLTVMVRYGFEKHQAETPWEFLERLRELPSSRFETARQVTALFSLIRYGGRDDGGEVVRTVRGYVKQLAAR